MTHSGQVPSWAQALGRVPSGLFIVTARRGESESGMLASWVQQCSFDPPLVTLAVKRGRWLAEWLTSGEPFVINILAADQTDMIAHFGRGFSPGEPAFDGLDVERADGGAAVLSEALAYLECRAESTTAAGDHDLLVARVIGGRVLNDGPSMTHVRKSGLHY